MGVLGELNNTPASKGKSKSKTPLKSPAPAPVGLLTPNNDKREKERNKLARQASEVSRRCVRDPDGIPRHRVRCDALAVAMQPRYRRSTSTVSRANHAFDPFNPKRRTFTDALDDADDSTKGSTKEPLSRMTSINSTQTKKPALSAEGVLNLYSNCIKLASENKINAKNTWSLALIDHISEIVRDSKDEDGQTNFQKSSCTLDAGVKIYASRVDSFHNETFKMLGGMNKVTQNEEDEDAESAGAKGDGQGLDGEEGAPKKRAHRPVQTLEAPEAHTLKALDDAVAVDPLFQKTSALFDEGGASGLLLNNLSVHRGCNICFDSEEVPEYGDAAVDDDEPPIDGVVVDLSSIAATIEQARRSAASAVRITPAVGVIEDLLHGLTGGDVASTAKSAKAAAEGTSGVSLFDFASGDGVQFAEYDDADDDDDRYDDRYNDDDAGGGFGAGFDDDGVNFADEFNPHAGYGKADRAGVNGEELDMEGDAGLEWVVNSGMGGKMAWAGPSHWRFKAPPKGVNGSGGGEGEGEDGEQKPKKREKGELTYDFENPGEIDEARFTLAATIEELQLVSAPVAVDTLLPPDLGYDASQLVKLSLRPNAGVSGVGTNFGGGDDVGDGPGYDDDAGFGGGFDGDDGYGFDADGEGGFDDPAEAPTAVEGLVAAPRRCEKIQVNYARQTKEVNVKELKSTLWENINDDGICPADEATGAHSFNQLLRRFPEDNLAGATEDISVHMAFICMLHLANENGLKITDRPGLDDLDISNLPGAIAAH